MGETETEPTGETGGPEVEFIAADDAARRLASIKSPPSFVDATTPDVKKLARIGASLRASDPNASFPSGDVAGATAFACALAPTHPTLALALVCGSAFGRLYWRAHHLLDCLAGAATTLAAHSLLAAILVTPEAISWKTPIVAEAFVLPLMKAFSTWKPDFHKGD